MSCASALSNDRLVAVADGRVRFRWRDYADGDRVKVMTLDVDEFFRRDDRPGACGDCANLP